MIENLKFKEHKSPFQDKLRQDVNIIRNSKEVFVPADKTSNYYRINRPQYEKLVKDNTTAKYKRTNSKITPTYSTSPWGRLTAPRSVNLLAYTS